VIRWVAALAVAAYLSHVLSAGVGHQIEDRRLDLDTTTSFGTPP